MYEVSLSILLQMHKIWHILPLFCNKISKKIEYIKKGQLDVSINF